MNDRRHNNTGIIIIASDFHGDNGKHFTHVLMCFSCANLNFLPVVFSNQISSHYNYYSYSLVKQVQQIKNTSFNFLVFWKVHKSQVFFFLAICIHILTSDITAKIIIKAQRDLYWVFVPRQLSFKVTVFQPNLVVENRKNCNILQLFSILLFLTFSLRYFINTRCSLHEHKLEICCTYWIILYDCQFLFLRPDLQCLTMCVGYH